MTEDDSTRNTGTRNTGLPPQSYGRRPPTGAKTSACLRPPLQWVGRLPLHRRIALCSISVFTSASAAGLAGGGADRRVIRSLAWTAGCITPSRFSRVGPGGPFQQQIRLGDLLQALEELRDLGTQLLVVQLLLQPVRAAVPSSFAFASGGRFASSFTHLFPAFVWNNWLISPGFRLRIQHPVQQACRPPHRGTCRAGRPCPVARGERRVGLRAGNAVELGVALPSLVPLLQWRSPSGRPDLVPADHLGTAPASRRSGSRNAFFKSSSVTFTRSVAHLAEQDAAA